GPPGRNRALACRVLALSGREDLAQDNLGYALGLDPGTLQRRRDRNLSELVGRQACERSVERADRGARGTDNDDIVLHCKTPLQQRDRERDLMAGGERGGTHTTPPGERPSPTPP